MTKQKCVMAVIIAAMLYNFIFYVRPFQAEAAEPSATVETSEISSEVEGEEEENGENAPGENVSEETGKTLEENSSEEEGKTSEEMPEESSTEENLSETSDGESIALFGLNFDKSEIIITTKNDLLALQERSQLDSLEGKTIIFSQNSEIETFPEEFIGLGNETFPFKGTLKSYYTAGAVYSLKTPLIQMLGEGARIEQFKADTTAPLVGTICENAAVTFENVVIRGKISTAGNAGTIAGEIKGHVNLTLKGVDFSGVTEVTSTDAAAGGVAGVLGESVTITSSDCTSLPENGVIKGVTYAGGYFGRLENGFLWNKTDFAVADTVTVFSNGENCASGQFAGELSKGTLEIQNGGQEIGISAKIRSDKNYIVQDHSSSGGLLGVAQSGTRVIADASMKITGSLGNKDAILKQGMPAGSYSGGIVGSISAGTEPFAIQLPENGEITIEAYVYGGIAAGGFAGRIEADTEIPKITVNNTDADVTNIFSGNASGGVIGLLSSAKCIIHSPDIQNGSLYVYNTNQFGGGIIGSLTESALEIDGDTVKVENLQVNFNQGNDVDFGFLVGKQEKSVAYFSNPAVLVSTSLRGYSPKFAASLYEVGGIGGVYRNKEIENGNRLIGGSTADAAPVLSQVGVLSYQILQEGSSYAFSDEKGFECFSIATNSQGRYGKEAFGMTGKTDSAFLTSILGAEYIITSTGEIDLSYENTGIVTLDRNDKQKGNEERFQGKLKGKDGIAVIKQNIIGIASDNINAYRQNAGLFCGLTGAPEFENLKLTGEVRYLNNGGGLAYDIKDGTSLTLKNITTEKEYTYCTWNIGGILAEQKESSDFELIAENLQLSSKMDVDNENCSGFINYLNKAKLNIQNITIGGYIKNKAASNSVSGFLGKEWKQVYGNINGITIEENTSYSVRGVFGVLLYQATSRQDSSLGLENHLTFKNVDLKNLTVDASGTNDANKKNCALLVRDGRNVAVSVENYSCAGCTIKGVNAPFDEIVGITNNDNGTVYGVVSLHKEGSSFPDYCYEYQATYEGKTKKELINIRTRYYYDLFQKLNDTRDAVTFESGTAVLDSPEKLLLWSVISYSKNTSIGTFKKIAGNPAEYAGSIQKIKIVGKIDLTGYSFYPIVGDAFWGDFSVIGENAEITFSADGIPTQEDKLPPHQKNQHYSLQAGLLKDIRRGGSISDLTLSGNVSKLNLVTGSYSGALVCDALNSNRDAVTSIERITLKNLEIKGYEGYSSSNGDGLLIGNIISGKVSFNDIQMEYSSAGKVAAALIGSAGSKGETALTIDFRNMKIADEANSVSHNGSVFKYASFLYYFDHEDSENYTGYGRYLFTEEEAAKKVTYGCKPELNNDTEYWWENENVADPHKHVVSSTGILPENYLPYTYSGDDILVNPKPVEIVTGCGTYEDPYIILDEKQFLMLYKYINEDVEQNKEFLDGFILNDVGDDTSFCDGLEASHTKRTFKKNGDNTDFPTQEELSRAYYRLGADVDLSSIESGNYAVFAKSFSGFGSLERPFCGVWYGKDNAGTIHTITLPDKSSASDQDSYGFIRYANGAVLKDMVIKTPGTAGTAKIKNTGCGGLAIGCVYGGDNIIDNVKVEGALSGYNTSEIGALVGRVRKGGIIFRNLTQDSVQTFSVPGVATVYQGSVVGAVWDGYAMHDNTTSENVYSDLNEVDDKKAISNYELLNENYFRTKISGLTIAKDDTEKTVTVTMPNEASLMLMTMALNSDTLGIINTNLVNTDDKYPYTPGYTQYSKTRKAEYSAIGSCTASTLDYREAVAYDNAETAYEYPYLYRYMGIADHYTDYVKSVVQNGNTYYRSILNDCGRPEDSAEDSYNVTWELAEGGNTTYDLTIFGQSFRGIGAIYELGLSATTAEASDGKNYGGTFHGSFDGKGNTIHYEIVRDTTKDFLSSNYMQGKNEGVDSVNYYAMDYAGLFNVLTNRKDVVKTIKNVALSGSIQTNDYASTSKMSLVAGALVGMQVGYQRLEISDITVLPGFSIGTQKENTGLADVRRAGGIVGEVLGITGGNASISLKNCKAAGDDTDEIEVYASIASGGMIGYVSNRVCEVVCENGTVQHAKLIATGTKGTGKANYTTYGTSGGMVGYYLSKNASTIHLEITGATVKDAEVTSSSDSGGVVGSFEPKTNAVPGELVFDNITVENVSVNGMRNVGGAIGSIGTNNRGKLLTGSICNVKVIDTIVRYHVIRSGLVIELSEQCQGAYVGGLLGFYGLNVDRKEDIFLSIKDVQVFGTASGKSKVLIQPANNNLKTNLSKTGSTYAAAGGLVGCNSGYIKFLGCAGNASSVDSVEINASVQDITYCGAGGIVGITKGEQRSGTESIQAGSLFPQTAGYAVVTSNSQIGVCMQAAENVRGYDYSAGGIFGFTESSILGEAKSYDSKAGNLICKENKVSGYYAGGVGGFAYNVVNMSDICVEGGSVTATDSAGGIFGRYYYSIVPISLDRTMFITKNESTENLVKKVTITGQKAGGAIGYLRNDYKGTIIHDFHVVESTIEGRKSNNADNCYVGGVIGLGEYTQFEIYDFVLETSSLYENETKSLGYIGGIIGKIITNNASQMVKGDYITISATNKFGIRKSGENVLYLTKMENNSAKLENPGTSEIGSLLADSTCHFDDLERIHKWYGYRMGRFLGGISGNDAFIYVLHQSVEYPDITDTSRGGFQFPVMDVGYEGSDMYTHQKQVHVLYGDDSNAKREENLKVMKEKSDYAPEKYVNGTGAFEELLASYRLNNTTSETKPTGQLSTFKASYPLIVSLSGTEHTGNILNYRIENSTLQQFVEDMADIMTNVSGVPSTSMPILSVKAVPMQWNIATDEYQEITTKQASIKTTKNGAAWNFDFNDGNYDTISADGVVTYTELIFTYGWKDYEGNTRQMQYALPIYVVEPIKTYVQSTIVAEQISVVDDVRAQGKTNVELKSKSITMINDSDYTLLLEYFYGNGRKKKEDAVVDKIFSLNAEDGSCFEKGTRFVLIDVTHGNQVYYYPAAGENGNVKVDMAGMPGNVSEIPFTYFIGVDGTSYVNQPISALADVEEGTYQDAEGNSLNGYGLEQYLLYVIKPAGTKETRVYDLHTELETGDGKTTELIKKALYGTTEADITVNSIPGITIALKKDGVATNLEGTMGKDTLITADATFEITADSYYWNQVEKSEILDGANYDKYLDVRISLMDEKGNRISLPSGTNFRYMIGGTAAEPQYGPYQAVTEDAIYYYKDIGQNGFKIRGEGGITKDTTTSIKIQLNFENADLLPYTEGKYNVCIDLIRSSDPKELEATKDDTSDENWHYEKTVNAVVVPSLGFAIRVPEEKQNKLAVNTYDCSKDGTQEIPFTVEFDFNDILKAVADSDKQKAIEKWAGYRYEVTFELFPKDEDGYTETEQGRYTGEGMSITVNGAEVNNGGKVAYNISQAQIKDNTGNAKTPIKWEGNQVTLDLSKLTGWSGEDLKNLTNYKLKATLRVTSQTASGTVTEAEIVTTSDFFIYTVTKLRTSAKGNT